MSRLRSSVAVSLVVVMSAVCLASCSSAPEQPILNQFFTASRLRDNTSLDNFSTVIFDPKTQGTVSRFSITGVSPETSRELRLKPLAKVQAEVTAQDDEFLKRRTEYQGANLDAIKRVLKAEGEKAPLKGKDADVQEAWTKIREEGAALEKKRMDAKKQLAAEMAVVHISTDDGRTQRDLSTFDGALISKEVTVSATVKSPDGQVADRTLVVTMERAELKGDPPISGRWVITGVK